jgi:UDP-2,3-diacylglucosamine pyrophosphatase LpxH
MPEQGLRIGFAADSQLQTRSNYNSVFGYRDRLAEFVVKTAIRPPALDWAARSMLRESLERLRLQKVQAIFYLGDGANNGCYDEFALGFQDGVTPDLNSAGVLALLDEFRRQSGIPVFFTLGNHDLLAAGSTAQIIKGAKLCEGVVSPNYSISKLMAMKLVDTFNAGNSQIAKGWTYRSNWNELAARQACGENADIQHRRGGCYLAATVDHASDEGTAQFLLLDTNDWVDVTPSRYLGLEQEGIRGAMSFQDDAAKGILSQTSWFDRNASQPVDLRVGLSHYDVAGLTKRLPLVGKASSKTQMYMKLFTNDAATREPIQTSAYVVTGHTHVREAEGKLFLFKTKCGNFSCAQTDRFRIRELNVGSTTDYSNYATFAQFQFAKGSEQKLGYARIETNPAECADVWSAMPGQEFPNSLQGSTRGWLAIGIDRNKPTSYHGLQLKDAQQLWRNLDWYAGKDQHKANCIGLYAAAVEVDVDPGKPRPAVH